MDVNGAQGLVWHKKWSIKPRSHQDDNYKDND